MQNSLARNAVDLLPCLSDGFGFLLFDGETVGPEAGRLRNRFIINDKQVSKETLLKDDNCKQVDLIEASTDILLISIVSKRPNSRSQNVPTISKSPNYS